MREWEPLVCTQLVEESLEVERCELLTAEAERLPVEPIVRAVQRDWHVRLPLVDHLLTDRSVVVEEMQAVVRIQPARLGHVHLIVPTEQRQDEPGRLGALLRSPERTEPLDLLAGQAAQEFDILGWVGPELLPTCEQHLARLERELHATVMDELEAIFSNLVPEKVAAVRMRLDGRHGCRAHQLRTATLASARPRRRRRQRLHLDGWLLGRYVARRLVQSSHAHKCRARFWTRARQCRRRALAPSWGGRGCNGDRGSHSARGHFIDGGELNEHRMIDSLEGNGGGGGGGGGRRISEGTAPRARRALDLLVLAVTLANARRRQGRQRRRVPK